METLHKHGAWLEATNAVRICACGGGGGGVALATDGVAVDIPAHWL